ncbi:MAG: carbohydrate kinase [Ruminococcus sp.]|nr:carbohydrate kinase [uncultured Ruminococcus sp.]MBQ1349887.1 carbohydrate kinase [Ruminococcus sp.]MBQ2470615.1 carbohydrate kinase [Ruminococcus sp.]MBQ3953573.1 carbohydrate kinase [Ruminococcus sp.]
MKDLVTIGEILIDLTYSGRDKGVPVYTANPGGAPANVAVAAARLGADAAFIGKVGRDYYGDFLRATLTENGVDISGMLVDNDAPTTLAVVSVSETGERSFSFYRRNCADTLLSSEEISTELLGNTRFLHFGSVSLTDDPARTATLFAAQKAKELGAVVTYDPNYRANLWNSEEEAVERMKSVLGFVDILKISDEELPLLTGTDDPVEGTRQLSDTYGISLILLTLGPDGAFYRRGEETGKAEGFKVKVADTNGAGDTFFGSFLSRMIALGIYRPEQLTSEQLYESVRTANLAASLTTSRHGAIPAMPDLKELEDKLKAEVK